jgi:hypothetical protein
MFKLVGMYQWTISNGFWASQKVIAQPPGVLLHLPMHKSNFGCLRPPESLGSQGTMKAYTVEQSWTLGARLGRVLANSPLWTSTAKASGIVKPMFTCRSVLSRRFGFTK